MLLYLLDEIDWFIPKTSELDLWHVFRAHRFGRCLLGVFLILDSSLWSLSPNHIGHSVKGGNAGRQREIVKRLTTSYPGF